MRQDLGRDPTAGLSEELGRMAQEPLLPIEKQLIVGSLLLGAVLLAILLWASYTFF
jgi:hypothetical protein